MIDVSAKLCPPLMDELFITKAFVLQMDDKMRVTKGRKLITHPKNQRDKDKLHRRA